MDLGYGMGDKVIQTADGIVGKVIKFYYPTNCKQQTIILCDDGRKYHAHSDTFIKVSELEKQIYETIKKKPQQIAMLAGFPAGQIETQSLLVPHDYRNIKVADGTTITIDLEKLKNQLVKSLYEKIGLNYGT